MHPGSWYQYLQFKNRESFPATGRKMWNHGKAPNNWKRLNTFSLHTPSARYYLHEWLLHKLWGKEDILTTRYDFVELKTL